MVDILNPLWHHRRMRISLNEWAAVAVLGLAVIAFLFLVTLAGAWFVDATNLA